MSLSGETHICNRALRLARAETLLSLEDDSETARACRALLPELRDEVLRAYPWNFAMARAKLADAEPVPLWGFAHAYPLPEDPYCLRVWSLEGELTSGDVVWRIEGRRLVTDLAPPVSILFIARIVDTALFDPLFTTALAARMAAELAYPLTGSSAKEENAWRLYERSLSEAKRIDAQEGTADPLNALDWLNARY